MRKIIHGSFVLALLASLGMTLVTHPAFASEKFVAKMKPYTGRILSPAEIKKVLTGNTVMRIRSGRSGRVYEIYWHYKTAKAREVSNSAGYGEDHTSKWIADPVKGYCHYRRDGREYCRQLRIFIEGKEVKITFVGGRKDRTRSLKEGEYSGEGY